MKVRPMLRCKRTQTLLGMFAALRDDSQFDVVLVDTDTMDVLTVKSMEDWDSLCKEMRAGTLTYCGKPDSDPNSKPRSGAKAKAKAKAKPAIPPANPEDLLGGLD